MYKTDFQLKQDIEDELRGDPTVNAARVGVRVNNGAVSLLGMVATYAKKWAAEDATKRVSGVPTVAQDLTVELRDEHLRTDSDIANAVQHALGWDVLLPKAVTATVRKGGVTIEGEVTWKYQCDAAESAIRRLAGVTSISNFIRLKTETSAAQLKEKIEAALQRHATADANAIHVETSGGKVTLTGRPSSWQSMHDAEDVAWAAPCVTEVVDNVRISI